ncbi:MAG TPA: UPF0182 family protein [Candidatus Acidoferrales bacterium]|nr:UPF0182 family protein [Candidatus Acidoferrales bacterium]
MKKTFFIIAASVIAVLAILVTLSRFFVDLLWFDALGFKAVFTTVWFTSIVVFGVATLLSSAVLWINGFIAARATSRSAGRPGLRIVGRNAQGLPEVIEFSLDKIPWRLIIPAVALILGLLVGFAQAANWDTLLKWLYAVPFGRLDPLFGYDLGFYIFSLPVYELLRDWGISIIFWSGLIALVIYWLRGDISYQQPGPPALSPTAIRHFSGLLAVYFLFKAAGYILDRYDLMISNNGVVFGAAYTDVHLRLPLLMALAGASLVGAGLCAFNIWSAGFRLPILAVALVFAVSLIETVVPGLFQSYWVKPDELRLESRYIANNITFTRYGFALDRITSAPFPTKGKLTPELIEANDVTIQNIRWWDPRPLLDTYRQLQEIRLYYDFRDVDVDRYTIDGSYRQVTLSARELNQAKLPADAQTWINQRFKFTHGNGIAVNPVNRFDEEGLPVFYVKDIPPAAPMELRIDRPEIYFGEQSGNYVVVGGDTKEFDYAKGQENVYNTYQGRDGVSLGSLWRRALFAWYFGDIKLFISDNVTPSSRILFRRLIQDRIQRIAPFLLLDRDPYLIVNDGRLVWMQDAYTVSDALPYSQRSANDINYIRNAVKITVDAYNGNPVFYIADPTDPIVQTYQRIFPSLFQTLDSMPASLRSHVRYPEDLFILQANVYGTYHMKDPEVFYNKEDLWSFPKESQRGQTTTMQPYYTIMRLPGESREEFILMLPMVPNNRDNMIAWLAARCDGANYGKVIEFAFSKDKLIYGPAQIEARIDQDTTISQQLSLWNQTGSHVIRGNLLVIPIEDTLLYVEPLYLSAESRQLPELKRLIASTGDRVVMSTDVQSLLAALFAQEGKQPAVAAPTLLPTPGARAGELPPSGANAEALRHYRQAVQALSKGDWRTFGAEMDALQKSLQGSKGGPPG